MFEGVNRRLGEFVALHPRRHIVVSLTLALLCTLALKDMRIENDIRTSFSPLNSRSSYEFAAYKEFFGLRTLPERSSILFSARDGGSMLRRRPLEDLLALDARYMRALSQRDPQTGIRTCDPQCDLSLPFYKIIEELLRIYRHAENATANTTALTPPTHLDMDFPFASLHGHRVFIGMNFVGVRTVDTPFPQNNSRVVYVKTIILWYFSRADTEERKAQLRNISLELFTEARHGKTPEHTDFEIFGDEIANMEMVRGAVEATMLMSIGFGLLLIFMAVCMRNKLRELSTPRMFILIVVAVLCPLLSSGSAFGILTWFGCEIYTIMCVTPFLICGIGVDDAFIMLQSWHAHTSNTPCARRRLGIMLTHVGPSIAITSLTNTVAFGIGYATPTPQMSLFCLCTSMAMFINYVLILTVLAPTLVLLSDAGTDGEDVAANNNEATNATAVDDSMTTGVLAKDGGVTPLLPVLIEPLQANGDAKLALQHLDDKLAHDYERLKRDAVIVARQMEDVPRWIHLYSTFLCSCGGRLIGAVLFITLLVISTLGVVRMKSSFEPSKAFPSDSPLSTSIQDIRLVFDQFFPINIFVHRPPNITDPADRRLFYRMVEDLERTTDSVGENRTLLWLDAYEAFDRSTGRLWEYFGVEHRLGYENLDYFLSQLNYPPGIKTELDASGVRQLRAFQFIVVARNMSEWLNRAVVEQKCREVLYRYPFNATLYDGDSAVLNLLLTAKLDLVGSIIVTVACMIIICSFFISYKTGVVVMSLTISCICYILVGMISWWGADLDPVTIVDVMLATGFSVDYTAHVAHQFYAKRGTCRERIAQSLHEMFVPMLEASGSTILCMMPLAFVPTYAIVNFAKTIFVVVAAGLVHGLFFMPTALGALPTPLPPRRSTSKSSSCFGRGCLRPLRSGSSSPRPSKE